MKRLIISLPALFICVIGLAQLPGDSWLRPRWAVGETATYRVLFTTAVQTDFSMLGSEARDTSLMSSLKGQMQFACTGVSAGKWYFYCSFAIDSSQFPLPAGEQQHIRESLDKGFYFSQQQQGIIDSVWFPYKVSEAAEHITLQLLEYYQNCLPATTDTGWQEVLSLTNGLVSASYKQGNKSIIGPTIRLTALTSLPESGQAGMLVRMNQYIAGVDYRYNRLTGRLQQVKGAVVRKAKINHKTITTLTNTFQYDWQWGGVAASAQGRISWPGATIAGRPIYYPEKLLQKVRENNLAKSRAISIGRLLQELRENESRKDENVQDKLTIEIKISLLAGKDSLSFLRKAFLEADEKGICFKTLRTGFITASTVYAQETVRDYMHIYKRDRSKMQKIIPSAGLMHSPMRLLQTELEGLAFDTTTEESTRTSAQLALGNMAGTLRYTDPLRADSIASGLAHFLAGRGDDMLLLSALGNCGTKNILPFVLPLLGDTNTAVKAYAFYALRFVGQPVVDSLYREALLTEHDPEILTNVLNALFLRSYDAPLAKALYKLVEESDAEQIQLAALQVLFEWSYRQPDLLLTIKEIAGKNSNAAVNKAARQFLARADE